MNNHSIYHYPKLTDLDKLKSEAIKKSMTEPVTLHFHPYDDNGCEEGEKKRGNNYADLPTHIQYVNGELQ